jgi:hypothetical protein
MVVNGSVILFLWPLAAACRLNKEHTVTQAKANFSTRMKNQGYV